MRCVECGAEMVDTSAPMVEDFRGEKLTIHGIERRECPKCGDFVLESGQLEKLSKETDRLYREAQGLLSPDEIKRLRSGLGLTQTEFETVLGVAAPTASRWETGRVVQTKVADNLMRSMKDFPYVAEKMIARAEVRREQTMTARRSETWEESIPRPMEATYVR